VARFRISKAAKRDLVEIAKYTRTRWGDEQRVRYLTQLDARFQWIARNPEREIASDDIKAEYWRSAEGRHVIFYRISTHGVDIIRILHCRMLPKRHL